MYVYEYEYGSIQYHESFGSNERDATLAMPRLILPSVQVNMRAGDMPLPEDNGIRYMKIPINAL